MLAIGAVASDEKPYFGGEIYSKETFKYGRFSATVRPSKVNGTVTSFYLYSHHNDGHDHYKNNEDWLFDEWNSISYVPFKDNDDNYVTKMSKDMN